jgi:hypothetical protein
MTTYWCVNFDSESKVCLEYGIKKNLWMMQYQYKDDLGNVFQDDDQKAATTANWKRLSLVKVGDKVVAYLPKSRFFAIGTVIEPRRSKTPQDLTDTIGQYVERKRSHDHKSGFVYYTPVFYEDFTDTWTHPDNKLMRYAQRIDVDQWQYVDPEGVTVKGLGEIPVYELHKAVFEIKKEFFDTIKKSLGGVSDENMLPEEVSASDKFVEGAVKAITVNAYERNQKARTACIKHYGQKCTVCGFMMAELYGEVGENVIHVHHLRELASIGTEYEVDPITDLRPVCPNCHAVLHTESPAMTIEQLQEILSKRKSIEWPAIL